MSNPNPTPERRPLKAREFFALMFPNAVPYIPEAHRGDCEDTACTRCAPAPLTPEREAIIRQQQPGDWLAEPWMIRETDTVDGTVWQVTHKGTVLATLPDWAGNLALWIAETHEDVPELLAELDRTRAVNADLYDRLDRAARGWRETQREVERLEDERDELKRERDAFRTELETQDAARRKAKHGCETPESHLYGCPCDTKGGA